MFKWLLILKKPSNQLWVTPAYWTILTVAYVFALKLLAGGMQHNGLPNITEEILADLLNVMASSMLAVSTFSLSIMVSAFAAAANTATPRAIDLVMDDKSTRTAISSFICAFIYAIIAKTALGMGFYAQNGRFVLFISTLAVLLYLIITLIRWVYTLSLLGRLGNTLNKIECATEKALQHYRSSPMMGATAKYDEKIETFPIQADCCGYLTHIDMQQLQEEAEKANCKIHIQVRPGKLITPDTVLCLVEGEPIEASVIQDCFVFARQRTFAQDPAWGFIVLSETAQRALSPAVNDPGTAIKVMTTMMSLLLKKEKPENNAEQPNYNRLSIIPLDCSEFIRDGFAPISRDGAAILEVNLVMQKVLDAIWRYVPEKDISLAAQNMAKQALERACQELSYSPDQEILSEKHHSLFNAKVM